LTESKGAAAEAATSWAEAAAKATSWAEAAAETTEMGESAVQQESERPRLGARPR
jgi:hypothetical protein